MCGDCCGYQLSIPRQVYPVLFLRDLTRRTQLNTKAFELSFYKKRSKRQMSWGSTRCVVLYPFSWGRKRLQITFCWGRCEFGFTIFWNASTFWQLWRHYGFCSTYHEWNKYCNPKNSTLSKRAIYNSTLKLWFCLKSFFVQIYSSLFLYYLHMLHCDAHKICGVEGSAGVDKQFV